MAHSAPTVFEKEAKDFIKAHGPQWVNCAPLTYMYMYFEVKRDIPFTSVVIFLLQVHFKTWTVVRLHLSNLWSDNPATSQLQPHRLPACCYTFSGHRAPETCWSSWRLWHSDVITVRCGETWVPTAAVLQGVRAVLPQTAEELQNDAGRRLAENSTWSRFSSPNSHHYPQHPLSSRL